MLELRAGPARATVDPGRGGRLASLAIGGRELLVPAPDDADRSIRWGSFVMAPWPGRLANGGLAWRGRTWQLARNHGRHAIHGLVFDRAWTTTEADGASAGLRIALADAGWPFGGEIRQAIRLAPDHLTLEAAIHADPGGDGPVPAALGWHPWFRRHGGEPDLRVASDAVLETERLIPTGRRLPVAGSTDLRRGPALGRRRLDHAYLDPVAPVVARWPDLELEIGWAGPIRAVLIHTPPGSLCVEPQTAWPDAMGPGRDGRPEDRGVMALEPGATLRATMTIAWRVGRA